VDMDNNISERMLRIPVLGRKNYWGNHAVWAGQLSAAMFSIIQTCAYNDPQKCVKTAIFHHEKTWIIDEKLV